MTNEIEKDDRVEYCGNLEAELAENERLIAEEETKPLPLFSIREDKKAEWEEGLANNEDGYGRACFRYAARWANLMEKQLISGAKLEEIAENASYEADIEGITGFMYGMAVSILSAIWEHGEALRRWHNLKVQFRNEGEKANESGGILNPAILCIGAKE